MRQSISPGQLTAEDCERQSLWDFDSSEVLNNKLQGRK